MGSHSDPESEGARLLQSSSKHGGVIIVARLRKAMRYCVEHEPLLLATLLGVAAGVILGTALSFANLSPVALEIIGLPGDLLMRTLKMLVLPLITASVMAGVCALRQSTADMGKVARYTLLYYFTTTMGAVILGITIVNIVRPGRGAPFDQLDPSGSGVSCHAANQKKVATHAAATSQHSPVEAFLGVIKSAFPDNIFEAAASMNVLGIITVSLLMGAALSSMGPEAAPMVALINIFNDAIGKIVNWVIWTSPVGIASLITTSICRACNLAATLEALGLFILAVLLGLLLWGFIILPAIYYATTRRNPGEVYRGFSQPMVTAFGTDSSNATLPITMRSAVAMGCDPRIVQFFLPLGTTVNMNGTALYEAVTVIFIAQAHGVVLGAAGTVIVALTATLAAVGAAGIPSAGLVTMLMVLQAVDLEQYASDIAIILAVDWFLDRCRTVVNVLGDSFGTVIIDHHARKWVLPGSPAAGPGKPDSDPGSPPGWPAAGPDRLGPVGFGIEMGPPKEPERMSAGAEGPCVVAGSPGFIVDGHDKHSQPHGPSHKHHNGGGLFSSHHHHQQHRSGPEDPEVEVRQSLLTAASMASQAEDEAEGGAAAGTFPLRDSAAGDAAGLAATNAAIAARQAAAAGAGGLWGGTIDPRQAPAGSRGFESEERFGAAVYGAGLGLVHGLGPRPAGGASSAGAVHVGGGELHHRQPHTTPLERVEVGEPLESVRL